MRINSVRSRLHSRHTRKTRDQRHPREKEIQERQTFQDEQEINEINEFDKLSKLSGLDGTFEVIIDKRIQLYSITPVYTLKDHDPLFDLARYLRTVERLYTIRLGPNLLWEVFDRWVNRNRDHLKPGHHYYTDFLEKLTQVNCAIGEGLGSLLTAARKTPIPTRAKHLCPLAHDLARLCRALAEKTGGRST